MNKYNSPPIILSTILKYLFEMRYLKYTNKFLHLIIPFKNKETWFGFYPDGITYSH